ncbi:glycosyltransferase family 4 protein [Streptomyces sp. NPDC052301]|uniref:glycosyltransferase family 4 protein n=1 Tax=Streptomyces sp. NPDC052301 TaxID=3365687 RepID=UPI0037D96B70
MGGTNRTTINLASALSERHQVEIVSVFQPKDAPLFAIDPRVKVTSLIDTRQIPEAERNEPARVFPAAETRYHQYSTVTDERAADYFRQNPPDVLIGTRPGLNVYVARFAGKRTLGIGQEHITLASHPEALLPDMKESYARLDALVTVSEADAENYRRDMAIPGLRVVSIPNSIPAPSLPAADPTVKTVVAAGRLAVIKRYDLLVRAFGKVAANHPDWQLRIYGDGSQRGKLRTLINDLGLYNQVHLMGLASPIEAEWVKGSIAAVTSDSESFGMTIVEAMRCGVPVVSTDCPLGPREIIHDGEDGLLVTPGDVDSIAQGLLRLIDDDEARAAMGAAARRNSERFDPAAIALRYEDLFRELGARDSTASPMRASFLSRLLRPRSGRADALRAAEAASAPVTAPMSGAFHADADGSLRVVLSATAPVDDGELLLIRRDEDRTTLRVPLGRDDRGRVWAPVERTLPLGNAVWDLWVDPANGPRRRLHSDLLDLRGLTTFRPDAQQSPVRALLPYETVDGFIALTAREADVHAEVQRVDIYTDSDQIDVAVRMFGPAADVEGFELRHRDRAADAGALELSWHRDEDGVLHARVVCAAVARLHHAEQDLWDLWVRIADRAEPVRVGGWFGDVKDRKKVYVYPVTVFEDTPRGRARVRPYYTVDNDLSVNAVDLP